MSTIKETQALPAHVPYTSSRSSHERNVTLLRMRVNFIRVELANMPDSRNVRRARKHLDSLSEILSTFEAEL